jgi:inosine/xanthosine triphosphatase
MKKVVVIASTNPVKIRATEMGFKAVWPDQEFEFVGVKASSEISNQPMTDEETLLGANNRAWNAMTLHPNGDFYVGLEGGVEDINEELHEFAWIVVTTWSGELSGKAKTCTFIAPEVFRMMVMDGKEVGEASDAVFGTSNSKQDMGAIGLLTRGVIDRAELYRHAVVSALIPFVHPELY